MAPVTTPQKAASSASRDVSGQAMASNGGREKQMKIRPRVLLMGPRSGGKSSIRKVVFEKLPPNQTLFIEKTTKTSPDDINSFISIDIWDLPGGQLDPDHWNLSFDQIDAVIFVLDAQGTFNDMIRKLATTMWNAYQANPGIQFEIFLHKVDGMSEDYRLDTLQNLRDRLTEDLFDMSPELESSMNVFYHLTSVFDNSIYEALSKVIQKLLPEQGTLERLLDMLCQQCAMDKAFLFDPWSKIYIATDSSPTDNQTYVLCSDYLDLVGDFSSLYEPAIMTPAHSRASSSGATSRATPISQQLQLSKVDASASASASSQSNSTATTTTATKKLSDSATVENRYPSSYTRLGASGTLALWTITPNLSLVALLRPNVLDQHFSLIECNVSTFREAVRAIFALEISARPSAAASSP